MEFFWSPSRPFYLSIKSCKNLVVQSDETAVPPFSLSERQFRERNRSPQLFVFRKRERKIELFFKSTVDLPGNIRDCLAKDCFVPGEQKPIWATFF